jgi:hypothetical protein
MSTLGMKLLVAVVAWIATRFMRRLSFPALFIAIALEIMPSVIQSIISMRERRKAEEKVDITD